MRETEETDRQTEGKMERERRWTGRPRNARKLDINKTLLIPKSNICGFAHSQIHLRYHDI